mmetsp:Transcript_14562/g.31965  ORF Transcript_14562/g.31965 Transcript_14562/m.31965 type:complete len:232 (-) Transcript_14562:236-931(-)
MQPEKIALSLLATSLLFGGGGIGGAAYQIPQPPPLQRGRHGEDWGGVEDALSSRRRVLLSLACGFVATGGTPAALADVTNKLASSTALRSLDRVQEQLPIKLKPVAQANNYMGIKQALRLPPFDQVRKDLLTVVRGGEDGPKAGELQLAYKSLIRSLEDIDATASIGMGRSGKPKPDQFQLAIDYDEIEKALEVFLRIGTEAADIPVQYDSRQTQIGSIDVRSGKVEPRVI